MTTPTPDDKVYELSAQGQSANVEFNVPQSLEGKGVVNIIRCRLPVQYSTHPGVDDMEILEVKHWSSAVPVVPDNYATPFHNQNFTTPTTEYGAFSAGFGGDVITLNKNAVGKVQSYNTPSQAIHHLEMAYLHTSVVASSLSIKYLLANGTKPSNTFWCEIFINAPKDGYYYIDNINSVERLYMTKGVNRLSNWLPTDTNKRTVNMEGLLNNFSATFTVVDPDGQQIAANSFYLLCYIKQTDNTYERPTITVDGGLKVTLAKNGSQRAYYFNEITAHRLNFDTLSKTEHVGKSQPNLNDCKKIVLSLTPQTQSLVTRHGGQESVFQNASISFTVFDDASGGDTDQIYSLSGDFMTNSLLKVGSSGSYAFRLQRFTVDPLKSNAQVSDIIMPPNSYTEIKYKMSPLETTAPLSGGPLIRTDYPPISAPRPVPQLVTTESSAKRPYSMINGEITSIRRG